MCSSPKLFAAYRVLHRLIVPRHPSCALSSLTTKKTFAFERLSPLELKSTLVSLDKKVVSFLQIIFFKTLSLIVNQPRESNPRLLPPSVNGVNRYRSSFCSSTFPTPPTSIRGILRSAAQERMVGVLGFEPRTSSLSGTRSNQLSYTPIEAKPRWASRYDSGYSENCADWLRGGKIFPRTPIFYELAASACPCDCSAPAALIVPGCNGFVRYVRCKLVEAKGLEPSTSCLQSRCSSH